MAHHRTVWETHLRIVRQDSLLTFVYIHTQTVLVSHNSAADFVLISQSAAWGAILVFF